MQCGSFHLSVLSPASLSAGEATPLVDVADVGLHVGSGGSFGNSVLSEPDVSTPGSGGLALGEPGVLVDVADVGLHVGSGGPLAHSVSSEPLVVHLRIKI